MEAQPPANADYPWESRLYAQLRLPSRVDLALHTWLKSCMNHISYNKELDHNKVAKALINCIEAESSSVFIMYQPVRVHRAVAVNYR